MQAGKRCLKGSTLKTEMKAVLFHPKAEEEMIASAVFYEAKSKGLGRIHQPPHGAGEVKAMR